MRNYKNLIELFNAINSLNKRKDDDFFKIFRDNFTYNKDLILTYIVNRYNIEAKLVVAGRGSAYSSIVCNEVQIGDYYFHYNVRSYNGNNSHLENIDKSKSNPNQAMSYDYAFYLIEKYKIKNKLI